MNQNNLDLIKTRNSLRETDYDEYKKVKYKITTECRIGKDKWLEINFKKIETDLIRNNSDKAYNKLKRLNYIPKTISNVVNDKSGSILFENDKVEK